MSITIAEQITAVRGAIFYAEYRAFLYPAASELGREANARLAALRAALATLVRVGEDNA